MQEMTMPQIGSCGYENLNVTITLCRTGLQELAPAPNCRNASAYRVVLPPIGSSGEPGNNSSEDRLGPGHGVEGDANNSGFRA
jgi:hypothetical protein